MASTKDAETLAHLFILRGTVRNLKHGTQATSESFRRPNKIDLRDERPHLFWICFHKGKMTPQSFHRKPE